MSWGRRLLWFQGLCGFAALRLCGFAASHSELKFKSEMTALGTESFLHRTSIFSSAESCRRASAGIAGGLPLGDSSSSAFTG